MIRNFLLLKNGKDEREEVVNKGSQVHEDQVSTEDCRQTQVRPLDAFEEMITSFRDYNNKIKETHKLIKFKNNVRSSWLSIKKFTL